MKKKYKLEMERIILDHNNIIMVFSLNILLSQILSQKLKPIYANHFTILQKYIFFFLIYIIISIF